MSADWMSDAACAGHPAPDWWFAKSYDPAQDARDTAEAIRICGTCPVARLCLQNALEREGGANRHFRHGVAGGLKAAQRATLSRRLPGVAPKAVLQPCPSVAAYDRHLAKGESCEPCRKAASAYRRSRRQVKAA